MSKSCRGSLLLLFICICVLAQSQGSPTIHNGAKVYVEKMDGFGDYFIAAMHSKQVPLTVITDKAKADYIVDGSAETNRAHVRATIKMVTNDDEVAFACSFDNDHPMHGKQSAAEDCAKKLKKEVWQ